MFGFNQFISSLNIKQCVLALISFLIVALGQPAWVWWFGVLAGACGYALFFLVLLQYPNPWSRFWIAAGWFFAIQLVQLSWSISHPYYYIYIVYILISFLLGVQFGFIGMLLNSSRVQSLLSLAFIASLWTLLEWSRLFFLTGFTWNPIGLSLSSTIFSMQMASIWGIFGLSFWVMLVNLLALRVWLKKGALGSASLWICCAAFPYVFGAMQFELHKDHLDKSDKLLHALLVQTAFPIEESLEFKNPRNLVTYVIDEWRQILNITKKHFSKKIDLIALPEFLVPFGTYSFVYPYEKVKQVFEEVLGPESVKALPALETPLASYDSLFHRSQSGWVVNNAFWAQAIANYFQAELVAGLEDAEDVNGQREYYSAALFFKPQSQEEILQKKPFAVERYEKRVLVPMGEYIPLESLKELAAEYGVVGSFTPGKCAKVMQCTRLPFGVSICYEETFGHLMRENRQLGAQLLVNLTSDVWYPRSRLPRQHFDHARLRTVENGMPLIRACNTGITGAIDSLGRTTALLGDPIPEAVEWVPDSILVTVPTYTYHTIYSKYGDSLILAISSCFIFLTAIFTLKKKVFFR